MSTIRYISDTHFHHKNMAIKRGFKDENEMNEYIISEWNKIVSKRDVTFILGDITMEKNNYEILNRLNGIKKVILGNHDQPQHVPELLTYVNNVSASKLIKDVEYGNILLSHIPIHTQEFEYRLNFNIHGHVHTNTYEDKRYINVSAEVIDYRPITLKELIYYNGERRYE
jgi:calcineurin-like phosphoesterase family protein